MNSIENEPFSEDVYIGFSAKDETSVKILKGQLERNNVSCYLRRTKDDTLTSIREGVKTSKKCLLFITSAYLEDVWYNMERPYVLEKVELFGSDTLIIVKNKSSQKVPREYQGYKEAVLTKEQLNDDKVIMSLVAAILKEPVMNPKYGPAASYFYGYLNIILTDFKKRVIEEADRQKWPLANTLKKMLIIVPESCICPPAMDDPGKTEFTDKFVFLAANRAGNRKRDYKNSLYKVKEGSSEYYFAGECATPLVTLYETFVAGSCNMNKDSLFTERDVFFYSLKAILNHPDNVKCKDQYKVVYWSDPGTKKPNRLNLHQFLLSTIKKELDFEAFNESSKKNEANIPAAPIRQQNSMYEIVRGRFELYEGLDFYPMNSTPRGKCLIINIIHFTDKSLAKRHGSDKDTPVLKKLFEDLRFDVEVHLDVTYETLETLLITMNRMDHSNYNAFVCCLLSHGKLGRIYTSDGRPVEILNVVQYFADKQCPSLKGKPKMFFIQACQSGYREVFQDQTSSAQVSSIPHLSSDFADRCALEEVHGKPCVECDAAPPIESTSSTDFTDRAVLVPSFPDFLMSYSTLPGSDAFRNIEFGSYYVQALDEFLRKGDEIDRALKQVTTKVKKDLKERGMIDGMDLSEQLPFHLTSAMERLIYLSGHNYC